MVLYNFYKYRTLKKLYFVNINLNQKSLNFNNLQKINLINNKKIILFN